MLTLTRYCASPIGGDCSGGYRLYAYDANGNPTNQNVTAASATHWACTWNPFGKLFRASNDTDALGSTGWSLMQMDYTMSFNAGTTILLDDSYRKIHCQGIFVILRVSMRSPMF